MGRILRRIRIEQGMTQEALVEGICTAGYLSRVENGSQIPSRQIYQLLMERLGESGYSYAYWQEEEEKEQTCRELLHALQTWQKEHVDEKLFEITKNERGTGHPGAPVLWHGTCDLALYE